MKKLFLFGSSTLALVLAPCGFGAALAAQPEESASGRDVLIVTAQKREQSAQEIPISLFAITGETVENLGISSIQDLGNTLAGVNISSINPGQMNLSIRGAADISGSNQASSVNGYYVDETAMSFVPGYMPELGLWDVERIEVLRGPQGTLFGEGSMGGTLRVITKKPDSQDMFGRIALGGSSLEGGDLGYSVLASVNVPIATDLLAMSVAGSYKRSPGWIDIPDLNLKDTNDAKQKDLRVAFRLTPSEAFTVDLSYLYNKIDSVDYGATAPGVLDPAAFAPGSGSVNALSPIDAELHVVALTLDYDLGFASLISASSWTDYDNFTSRDYSAGLLLAFGDPDGTGNQLYRTQSEAFTQEVRLVSNGDQKLDWTIGAYYKDEDRQVDEANLFFLPAFGNLEDAFTQRSTQPGSSWAVFGEVDLELTEQLSVQAGLRYYSEDKDFTNTQLTSSVLFGTVAGDSVSGSGKAHATSPKIALNFKATPDVLLFAKVAKGFRGGGANIVDVNIYPEATTDYGPDSLWAYEVGMKTTPADGWHANVYAFYNDWTDLQLPFRTNDGLIGFTTNAGSATSKGGEVEIGGPLADGFDVGFTYSYTDSTIDDDVFDPQGNLVAAAGNRIPQSPKHKFTLTGRYTTQLTSGLQGELNGRYRQASGFHSNPPNNPAFFNDGYKQLFLSVGVSGEWGTLRLYGDNLLDRNDTTFKYQPISVLPYIYSNYWRPRIFGVEYLASF